MDERPPDYIPETQFVIDPQWRGGLCTGVIPPGTFVETGREWGILENGVIVSLDGAVLAEVPGGALRNMDLSGRNLRRAKLSDKNLTGADLSGADLSDSDLSHSVLNRSNLDHCLLRNVNLYGAKLCGVTAREADFDGVSLGYVDLDGADLTDAKLDGISFEYRGSLASAILTGTCLDQSVPPNGDVSGFTRSRMDGFVVAFCEPRGRQDWDDGGYDSIHDEFECDFFSRSPSPHQPGIFIYRFLDEMPPDASFACVVRVRVTDIHRCSDAVWKCRKALVIGQVPIADPDVTAEVISSG